MWWEAKFTQSPSAANGNPRVVWRDSMCVIESPAARAAVFSQNSVVTRKNDRQTDCGYSGLTTWQIFSQKWMKRDCYFEQLTLFVPSDKIQAFEWKLGFWKNLSLSWTWRLPDTSRLFWWDWQRYLWMWFFWCPIMKCVNIWKLSITHKLPFSIWRWMKLWNHASKLYSKSKIDWWILIEHSTQSPWILFHIPHSN